MPSRRASRPRGYASWERYAGLAYRNRAVLYAEMGEHGNALLDAEAALAHRERDAGLYAFVGVCHHRLGDHARAVAAFSGALAQAPHAGLFVLRGNVFSSMGSLAGLVSGMQDFTRAMHIDPTLIEARVNLTVALRRLGAMKQAWRQATQALQLSPRDGRVLAVRGLVSLEAGNVFGALLDVDAACTAEPTADRLCNRGVLQMLLGSRTAAMDDFRRALQLDGRLGVGWHNVGCLYLENRQWERARESFDEALRSAVDGGSNVDEASCLMNRALAHSALGAQQLAVVDMDRVLELRPQWARAWLNRGHLRAALGEDGAAEADYTRALALSPLEAAIYVARAVVRGRQRRLGEAVQDHAHALALSAA